ncbi:MAG: Holliday junction branch migration protein RuvA, partial [Chloroflexota bacterium]
MIAQLTGSLLRIEDDSTVIDVNGVGFRVAIPNAEMFSSHQIGDMVTLYTYLHVRENALSLYGFQTDEEKELFQVLIGVSGVGPKLALTMLSSLPMDTLRTAITTQRSDLLEVVPGIGRKTAQRILFDLHDKADLAAAIHLRESVSDVEQEV